MILLHYHLTSSLMLHIDASTEKYAPFTSDQAYADADSSSDLSPHQILKYCAMQLETRGKKNYSNSMDCNTCNTSTMPPGWIREVRQRKTGKTAGRWDVYIIR